MESESQGDNWEYYVYQAFKFILLGKFQKQF
jgi:hypothetical protein